MKQARLTKWQPKTWQPEYETIVALSATGMANTELAVKFGYTKEHISNILSTDEARAIKKLMVSNLRDKANESIASRLERIAEKTVDRLEQLLTEEDRFDKSPLSILDRGLDVLRSQGHLKTSTQLNNPNTIPGVGGGNVFNTLVLPAGNAATLVEGMNKANEVAQLHAQTAQAPIIVEVLTEVKKDEP